MPQVSVPQCYVLQAVYFCLFGMTIEMLHFRFFVLYFIVLVLVFDVWVLYFSKA